MAHSNAAGTPRQIERTPVGLGLSGLCCHGVSSSALVVFFAAILQSADGVSVALIVHAANVRRNRSIRLWRLRHNTGNLRSTLRTRTSSNGLAADEINPQIEAQFEKQAEAQETCGAMGRVSSGSEAQDLMLAPFHLQWPF
jgi:hypothetical protein